MSQPDTRSPAATVTPNPTRLRDLIANDAFAATFQSLGQYRSALLRRFAELDPFGATQNSAAAEREACAQLCEQMFLARVASGHPREASAFRAAAALIRERGQ